jgi:hypothetical protein
MLASHSPIRSDPEAQKKFKKLALPDKKLARERLLLGEKYFLPPLWPLARGLSPLARATTGGVVRTNEDPLPQKRGEAFSKLRFP